MRNMTEKEKRAIEEKFENTRRKGVGEFGDFFAFLFWTTGS